MNVKQTVDSLWQCKAWWPFSKNEKYINRNSLVLLGAIFGIKIFVKAPNRNARVLSDNTTTVYSISKMRSNRSEICHMEIYGLWDWVEQYNLWITAAHIPGNYNVKAEKESWKSGEKNREWIVNKSVFEKIIQYFQFHPQLDLFASRLNKQLPVFASYITIPEAILVNAPSFIWEMESYAFLSFS